MILVFIALLTVFSDDGVDHVGSPLLREILVFDVDDRGVATAHNDIQLFLLDIFHEGHGFRTLHGDGHLFILHLREIRRCFDLDIADRTLQRLTYLTRQLRIELIVVFLELVDLHVAVLVEVKLHAHIVFLSDVFKRDGDGQILAVEVFVTDALDGVAHVEVHLVHHIVEQPGTLHGIELVVDVRRSSESDESSEFCQSSQLSHECPHGALVLHEHLCLLRIFGRSDHEIDDGQQHDDRH